MNLDQAGSIWINLEKSDGNRRNLEKPEEICITPLDTPLDTPCVSVSASVRVSVRVSVGASVSVSVSVSASASVRVSVSAHPLDWPRCYYIGS